MSALPVVLGIDFGGTKIAIAVAIPSADTPRLRHGRQRGEPRCPRGFDRGMTAARDLLAAAAPIRT